MIHELLTLIKLENLSLRGVKDTRSYIEYFEKIYYTGTSQNRTTKWKSMIEADDRLKSKLMDCLSPNQRNKKNLVNHLANMLGEIYSKLSERKEAYFL